MRGQELREKTDEELLQIRRERRDDLMHVRIQMATGVVDNVRSVREARKDIARINTILNERARAEAATAAGDSK